MKLSRNMILQSWAIKGNNDNLDYILSMGNGNASVSNDGNGLVDIIDDLLINDIINPLEAIIHGTYPNLWSYLLTWESYSWTYEMIELVNGYIVFLFPRELRTFLSANNICNNGSNSSNKFHMHDLEYLNNIYLSRLLSHELKLKVGITFMFIQNID